MAWLHKTQEALFILQNVSVLLRFSVLTQIQAVMAVSNFTTMDGIFT